MLASINKHKTTKSDSQSLNNEKNNKQLNKIINLSIPQKYTPTFTLNYYSIDTLLGSKNHIIYTNYKKKLHQDLCNKNIVISSCLECFTQRDSEVLHTMQKILIDSEYGINQITCTLYYKKYTINKEENIFWKKLIFILLAYQKIFASTKINSIIKYSGIKTIQLNTKLYENIDYPTTILSQLNKIKTPKFNNYLINTILKQKNTIQPTPLSIPEYKKHYIYDILSDIHTIKKLDNRLSKNDQILWTSMDNTSTPQHLSNKTISYLSILFKLRNTKKTTSPIIEELIFLTHLKLLKQNSIPINIPVFNNPILIQINKTIQLSIKNKNKKTGSTSEIPLINRIYKDDILISFNYTSNEIIIEHTTANLLFEIIKHIYQLDLKTNATKPPIKYIVENCVLTHQMLLSKTFDLIYHILNCHNILQQYESKYLTNILYEIYQHNKFNKPPTYHHLSKEIHMILTIFAKSTYNCFKELNAYTTQINNSDISYLEENENLILENYMADLLIIEDDV